MFALSRGAISCPARPSLSPVTPPTPSGLPSAVQLPAHLPLRGYETFTSCLRRSGCTSQGEGRGIKHPYCIVRSWVLLLCMSQSGGKKVCRRSQRQFFTVWTQQRGNEQVHKSLIRLITEGTFRGKQLICHCFVLDLPRHAPPSSLVYTQVIKNGFESFPSFQTSPHSF